MALLQISEPGLSAAPHQRRLAVLTWAQPTRWWQQCAAVRPKR